MYKKILRILLNQIINLFESFRIFHTSVVKRNFSIRNTKYILQHQLFVVQNKNEHTINRVS